MNEARAVESFSETVLSRDGGRCVLCGASAELAHLLIDVSLWEAGAFHPANGVALCQSCHFRAESTLVSPDELREAAGLRQVLLPAHFDPNLRWDRWGNVIVSRDRRLPGEIFYREDVQRVLEDAGVLALFEMRRKYPRTMHLEWSENLQNDDRRLLTEKYFEGEEVIVTEKLDGENTTMTADSVHARSLDSGNHPSRAWVKQLHGRIRHEIPVDFQVCGENVFAIHSIEYRNLETYFYVFNIWERGTCLGWDDTVEYATALDLKMVRVLWRGLWDRKKLMALAQELDEEHCEGYVVRVTRAFDAHEFSRVVGKYVRKAHVRTSTHWMEGPVIANKLIGQP